MASLDRYNRWARLAPAFIVLLPLGIAGGAWAPSDASLLGTIGGFGGAAALSMLLAQVVRDAGKREEPALFERWGGTPTSRQLSYRHTSLNHHTLTYYHERLRRLRPDLTIPPSREAELEDPHAADAVYESLTDSLREATRDTQAFSLVHEEVITYGFRRNLWAMKRLGILTSLTGTGLCALRLWQLEWAFVENVALTLSGAACLALSITWITVITPDWVRVAAFEYANRLLAAVERLPA